MMRLEVGVGRSTVIVDKIGDADAEERGVKA